MKLCVIFRGEVERNHDRYVNANNNIDNWNEYLFNDLNNNGYEYDIIFVSYKCNALDELLTKINIKDTILVEKDNSSQIKTLEIVNKFMQNTIYDRYIILRFDVVYKIKITQWSKWNENGIIIPNPDLTWNESKLYNDIIFIIDKQSLNTFNDSIQYMMNIDNSPKHLRIDSYPSMPHHIGQYLYINNLEFHIMYDTLYHGVYGGHPVYVFCRCL